MNLLINYGAEVTFNPGWTFTFILYANASNNCMVEKKMSNEVRTGKETFNTEREEEFAFTNYGGKPVCRSCQTSVRNLKRHYNAVLSHFIPQLNF